MQNKFSNGKIYKIVSNTTNKFYIGSTTKDLKERLRCHQSQYKSFLKGAGAKYLTSFEIVKDDDHYIKLLKEVNCESRAELNKEEGEFIKMFKDQIVNKNIAGPKTEEEIMAYVYNYRIEHRDKMLASLKKSYYKKIKCDSCDCEYNRGSKTHHLKSKKHLVKININLGNQNN
jgi:predicted GIY-YIG superfamily endonuclease